MFRDLAEAVWLKIYIIRNYRYLATFSRAVVMKSVLSVEGFETE